VAVNMGCWTKGAFVLIFFLLVAKELRSSGETCCCFVLESEIMNFLYSEYLVLIVGDKLLIASRIVKFH